MTRHTAKLGYILVAICVVWTCLISILHVWRNQEHGNQTMFRVGFVPITCHLLCPVTSKEFASTDLLFKAIKFTAWPDMCEALRSGELDFAFILAPLAILLKEQGVDIKLVLLGHRNGSGIVTKKDTNITSIKDLAGKRVAIPTRYSNQNLTLLSLLNAAGMDENDIQSYEMPPPDMPSALATGAIDAYVVGEPYVAQSELANTGNVLYLMKDVRPGFISSVLVVRREVLESRTQEAKKLIQAFHNSSTWIETHRKEAASIGAKAYGLPEKLISHVLLSASDRVTYNDILPVASELDTMQNEMFERGLLRQKINMEALVDTSWQE